MNNTNLKNKNTKTLLNNIIYVKEKRIGCDGGDDFGHPLVYLNLGNKGKVVCPYCSKVYVFKK